MRVGLCGLGTVGAEVARRLQEQRDLLQQRCGESITLHGVAVRDTKKKRDVDLRDVVVGTDPVALASADGVDIVIEVMGGTDIAAAVVRTALEHGKPVITANKQLIATQGAALEEIAEQNRTSLRYSAAVGGGVPILETLEHALLGEQVTEIFGILNGTTSFILDAMADGRTYADALGEAQKLGLAEADPSEDVDGLDAAAKLVVSAESAWQTTLDVADVDTTGIRSIDAGDIATAAAIDCKLVLLARARRDGDTVWLSVKPTAVPRDSPVAAALTTLGPSGCGVVLASTVNDPVTVVGTGAGARPTASAILRDLVAATLRPQLERPARTATTAAPPHTRETGALIILRSTLADAENVVTQFLEDRGLRVTLTAAFDDNTLAAVTAPAMSETIAAAMETLEALDGVEVIKQLDALT